MAEKLSATRRPCHQEDGRLANSAVRLSGPCEKGAQTSVRADEVLTGKPSNGIAEGVRPFAANVIALYHSRHADHNLSEMPSGFHVPAGRTHLVKAKRAIDYRLDLVGGDGGILHYVHHVLPDSGIAMTLPLRMV